MKDCIACAGTGKYDHNGSPPCDSCSGTGRRAELTDVINAANRLKVYEGRMPLSLNRGFIHVIMDPTDTEWRYRVHESDSRVFRFHIEGMSIRQQVTLDQLYRTLNV